MDTPPRKRQTGLNYDWLFWPVMGIVVLNVEANKTSTSIIVLPVGRLELIKSTIFKPCANIVTCKQPPGDDQMVRVAPNPGEPDEGKLSSPVR
jgi:hypothetical protein